MTSHEACEFENCPSPATVATFVRIGDHTGSIFSCWVHSLQIKNEQDITVLNRDFLLGVGP